jgi:hypothetical protein
MLGFLDNNLQFQSFCRALLSVVLCYAEHTQRVSNIALPQAQHKAASPKRERYLQL